MDPVLLAWIALILGIPAVAAARWLLGLRGPSLAMAMALTGALGLWLAAAGQPPQEAALRIERPFSVLQTAWVFRLTPFLWSQGLGALLAGFLVGWMWTACPGQGRRWPRVLTLGMLVAATGAVLAADLFTLLMTWAALDAMFLALLLVRRGQAVVDRAALAGLVNGAALLALWAAAWQLWRAGDSLFWSRMGGEAALPLFVLATLIRLDIYPFHVGRPPELADEVDRAALLYILPTAVGLTFWAHRVPMLQGWPGTPWVAGALGLTAVLGGLWAWAEPDPRAGLVEAAWGSAAWWALVALMEPALAPLAAALWPVCFALLFTAPSFHPASPWGLPALAAILTLAGVPLMPGAALFAGLFRAAPAWAWPILLLPHGLLLSALVRGWLRPMEEVLPSERVWRVLYGLGLTLGVAGLIGLGLALRAWQEELSPPLRVVLVVGLGLAVGIQMQAHRVHEAARRWARVRPFLTLDWLYAGLTHRISRPAAALQQALEFLGHPAAMWLWALVVGGILLLLWQGSAR